MKSSKPISMERTSVFLFRMALALISVNILGFILIGYSYVTDRNLESEAGSLFRVVNTFALTVNESEGSVPPEAYTKYKNLTEAVDNVSRVLVRNTELPPPAYTTPSELESYAQKIRDFAGTVRQNSAKASAALYVWIIILILASTVAGIVLLFSMFSWRKSQGYFNRQMDAGFKRIEMLLKYQTPPEINSVGKRQIAEIEELNRVISQIASDELHNRKIRESQIYGNLNVLVEELYNDFRSRMACDRAALAFLDSSDNVIAETVVSSYKHSSLEPGFKEHLGRTHLGTIIQSRESRIINDLSEYAKQNRVSTATKKILEEGIKSSMTIPMFFNNKCLGFFFVSSMQTDVFDTETLNYTNRLINLTKQNLYMEFLFQQMISEISNAFVTLMHEKDNETSDHIKRMSLYSYAIARSYHDNIRHLEPRFMREILWYAPLHDIGKVGTPDSILLKNGPLNTGEMSEMKNHVLIGKRVMEKMNDNLRKIISFPLLQTAIDIIYTHHEKFDGTGYPCGLKGPDIPLAGRIIALADVFDALTSKRPYKDAYSIEEAMDIIDNQMSANFDPDIVKAFKMNFTEIQSVYDRLKEV